MYQIKNPPPIRDFMNEGSLKLSKILNLNLLHCIAEIPSYWLETKPAEIDNPRHHYQIA